MLKSYQRDNEFPRVVPQSHSQAFISQRTEGKQTIFSWQKLFSVIYLSSAFGDGWNYFQIPEPICAVELLKYCIHQSSTAEELNTAKLRGTITWPSVDLLGEIFHQSRSHWHRFLEANSFDFNGISDCFFLC